MDEQRLWAPWRLSYIKGKQAEPAPPTPTAWRDGAKRDCFLCRAAADYDDQPAVNEQLLVFYRGACSQGVLNRYPYSNGHLLLAPLRHVADLAELTDEEHLELMHALARTKQQLAERLTAQGFNIGLNLGQIAGAGVPGHLHWHIVPRWTGDHNFMSTTAGVRVIPQALEELWRVLCDCDA
ncbi:AP-4-A phosphorylase [Posidoniimonas polymericola]|uniref:AP-4-A phosphorylase n=1 Tax=Posidoniimonas polymericola TaxID=2528002 RepID=A0A5C5YGX1_9BACT|nr:HIT domain-containing protein [Posidoniimonas polymericola]TWT73725.1 AP-4-A phosphorylase [Posidoniimonas polymericola]